MKEGVEAWDIFPSFSYGVSKEVLHNRDMSMTFSKHQNANSDCVIISRAFSERGLMSHLKALGNLEECTS
jgi:hypothetical protein